MKMPGGGFFKVGAGQVTDDSEQAMCLMWAIVNSNTEIIERNTTALNNYEGDDCLAELAQNVKSAKVDPNEQAKMYKRWLGSRPFDIGGNTRATLGALTKIDENDPDLHKIAMKAGAKSLKSESNGSMMRISPLIVWCGKLKEPSLICKVLSQDIVFTHNNPQVH